VKRPLLLLLVAFVALLLVGGWLVFASKPSLPVVGMTEVEVEKMLGVAQTRFLADNHGVVNGKVWETTAGCIYVEFDDHGRAKEVQFHPDDTTLWERFCAWLGFEQGELP
jgi:hypothetical protein